MKKPLNITRPIAILWLFVSAALILAGCADATPSSTPTISPAASAFTKAVINGATFQLEVADDASSRSKGLSGRQALPEDAAMLFVYESEGHHGFWMKDTRIPLDLLFIDKDLKIVGIETMQPEPGVSTSNLKSYLPPGPVLYAIEMNAELSAKFGFKVGMSVELR